MRNNGPDASQTQLQKSASISTEAKAVELTLPLHVYKHLGRDGKPDLYIIGVWNGTTAEAVCMWQPLEAALQALGRTLTAAGTTEGTSSLVAK